MNGQRNIAGTQNRPVRFDSSATSSQQIIDSRRSIDQLWQKLTNLEQVMDKVLAVVDFRVTMTQLTNLINKKNGHTVSMPDNTGVCADHDVRNDSRYLKKSIFPVYNDLQFPVAAGKVPAANTPTFETFTTNTKEYSFAVNDYIDLAANEVPHSWKEGSVAELHLHITLKAANSSGSNRFAKFSVFLAYVNKAGIWAETTLTQELTIPTGTAALTLKYLDMGDLALTGFVIGTELKATVKRIAATGGTEYSGNIFVTQFGAHLQDDTVGSRSETEK